MKPLQYFALVTGILVVLLIPIKTAFNFYDEGLTVFAASRVMRGDIPYRDFWTMYPPGQISVLSVLFKVFGASLMVARLYDVGIQLFIALGVLQITKRSANVKYAVLACSFVALSLNLARAYAYPLWSPLALCIWSIVSLIKHLDTNAKRWLLVAGLAIGIAFGFRWDIGLYGIASTGLALASAEFCRPLNFSTTCQRALVSWAKKFSWLLAGVILVAIPFYGYFNIRTDPSRIWAQIVVFPLTIDQAVRRLPPPTLLPPSANVLIDYGWVRSWFLYYIPIFVYLITFTQTIRAILSKSLVVGAKFAGKTAASFLGSLLLLQAHFRYDDIHVEPTLIFAIVLISIEIHEAFRRQKFLDFAHALAPTCVLLLAAAVFSMPVANELAAVASSWPFGCFSKIERAGCVQIDPDQESAIDFIKSHTLDDQPIFVGVQDFDQLYVNDVGFYFLANRPSASFYEELFPGIATTRSVQETIAGELDRVHVEWIVLVDIPKSHEPNMSSLSSGVRYLDDYIRANYVRVETHGRYEILKRMQRMGDQNDDNPGSNSGAAACSQ